MLLAISRNGNESTLSIFQHFVEFLRKKQASIISQLEEMDGSGELFTDDRWGKFAEGEDASDLSSGGITRVIQGGNVIEKGACSFTLIENGVLSRERASTIKSRADVEVNAGDQYHAAALSIVLHSRSPLVPTFRSDVRIFSVVNAERSIAWFGGGADLTPYFLVEEDVRYFHDLYRNLSDEHVIEGFDYQTMKEACDDYFYLPARGEHRGTGGIFFDDMPATSDTLEFVKGVANSWLPSWLPIVEQRRKLGYTEKHREWQLLRRGRYLEFNLLYDRGVKFGLQTANPRVEGVMVSAPPLVAWEYNHKVEPGSEQERLLEVLKHPVDWAS